MGLRIFYTLSLLLFVSLTSGLIFSQGISPHEKFYDQVSFHRCDTMRGMLSPERRCFDVTYYALDLRIDPDSKSISGYVDIHFRVLEDFSVMQIDLFRNMIVDSISNEFGQPAEWSRNCDAVMVQPGKNVQGTHGMIRVHYHGTPVTAPMPPWDGGFVWATDNQGFPWVGVACEGDGASLWWPNKDHLSDEPDSVSIRIEVPAPLTCVANGNLREVEQTVPGWHAFNWFVSYPINNYNVTVNIGRYAHFSDIYIAADGDSLQCDYYVLEENLDKARSHFQQVHPMLSCFETYFGKYPFWNDGFALVETPYLGMEHQSAIAYGNKYLRGYLGGMIPSDMDWDYIIIHETGHEYWGNSISCNDLSEMWIHESFTTYMEALYVECRYSYQDAVKYLLSQRGLIRNKEPIIGPADVNWHHWKSSDHYYKGAWVLHTLRHAIGNDGYWFGILMEFYQTHAISQVTTQQFIDFVNLRTGKDWTAFFRQYLLYPGIPRLAYEISEVPDGITVTCRWETDVDSFMMPVLAGKPGMMQRIEPSSELQTFFFSNLKPKDFQVATDLFYITASEIEE